MLYLAAGVAIGPAGLSWLAVDPVADAAWLERFAEVAVLVSLFVTGLKIDVRATRRQWRSALVLASVTMVLTIAALAWAGHAVLGLAWAPALLLGAILAPTDPVLAAEIQVRSPEDRDALRLALSGEAGLNDGTAFPFVMLGLGLMGLHDLGPGLGRWLALDVAWAVGAGVGIGWAVGHAVGWAVGRVHGEAGREPVSEFVAVGAIAASFGAAQAVGGYGFLAVFVTGLGLRRAFTRTAPEGSDGVEPVLQFNGQLERIVEFVLVIVAGAALATVNWSWPLVAFVVLALVAVRPLAVALTLPALPPRQKRLVSWFGIRGVGSLYYLAYALHHGAAGDIAPAVLAVVAASVVVHGLSATPLMARYDRRRRA